MLINKKKDKPVKDLLKLRGSLKSNISATPYQIRSAFVEYTAQKN